MPITHKFNNVHHNNNRIKFPSSFKIFPLILLDIMTIVNDKS